ncbi:MAG TPA: hypothetical protein VHX61_12700 [Rhizomicrobium sp.]|jgi:hypothetical protein|nr:hypothetical protein [Rhizomicrobium sp.]
MTLVSIITTRPNIMNMRRGTIAKQPGTTKPPITKRRPTMPTARMGT